jgi:hypothetical protein
MTKESSQKSGNPGKDSYFIRKLQSSWQVHHSNQESPNAVLALKTYTQKILDLGETVRLLILVFKKQKSTESHPSDLGKEC